METIDQRKVPMNPDNDNKRPEDQEPPNTASFDGPLGDPQDPKPSGEDSFKRNLADRIGEVIGGYKLRRFLGKGGFGEVYAARHTKTNRVVAIKLVRSDRVASILMRTQLKRRLPVIATKSIVDILATQKAAVQSHADPT